MNGPKYSYATEHNKRTCAARALDKLQNRNMTQGSNLLYCILASNLCLKKLRS